MNARPLFVAKFLLKYQKSQHMSKKSKLVGLHLQS